MGEENVKQDEFEIWECKIVVSSREVLPIGFDAPPRAMALAAVSAAGVNVVSCFSGWGGSLTPEELNVVRSKLLQMNREYHG